MARIGLKMLLWLLELLLPRRSADPGDAILVLRVDERLGNLLLTTPLLRSLRLGFPQAQLHVLTAGRKANVLSGSELIDRVIAFEKRWMFVKPWRLWAQFRQLRRQGYRLVIDASHVHAFSATHAILAAVCGGATTIGHDRGPELGVFDHRIPDPGGYEVDRKLSLLSPLSIEPAGRQMVWSVDPGAIDPGFRQRWQHSSARVVIHPGGRKEDHRWPEQNYAALIAAIEARFGSNLQLVLSWGPGERELADRLATNSHGALVAPPTTVEEMAWLYKSATALICGDTGPMHLAVALGIPTCSLFVRSDPGRWGHPMDGNLVVAATQEQPVERLVIPWLVQRFGSEQHVQTDQHRDGDESAV